MKALRSLSPRIAIDAKQFVVGPTPFRSAKSTAAPPAHRTCSHVCLASSIEDDVDFEQPDTLIPSEEEASTSYAAWEEAEDNDSRQFAVAIAKQAWETKGEDLLVLHVAPLVYWTRYMVFATVFSRPQLNAILAKVEKEAKEKFDRMPSAPVNGQSAWELLDFGDVVVHVMTAEQREYYDMESFYAAAEEVELPFVDGMGQGPAWETKL